MTDLLQVESFVDGPQAVVRASGEVDLATVDRLSAAVTDCVQASVTQLTVDLESVSYLDSAGLRALVSTHKEMAAAGGSLTVVCSQRRILQIFEVTGLSGLLTIVSRA